MGKPVGMPAGEVNNGKATGKNLPLRGRERQVEDELLFFVWGGGKQEDGYIFASCPCTNPRGKKREIV